MQPKRVNLLSKPKASSSLLFQSLVSFDRLRLRTKSWQVRSSFGCKQYRIWMREKIAPGARDRFGNYCCSSGVCTNSVDLCAIMPTTTLVLTSDSHLNHYQCSLDGKSTHEPQGCSRLTDENRKRILFAVYWWTHAHSWGYVCSFFFGSICL